MSKPLIEKAQKILLNNHQKGGFTIPTEKLISIPMDVGLWIYSPRVCPF